MISYFVYVVIYLLAEKRAVIVTVGGKVRAASSGGQESERLSKLDSNTGLKIECGLLAQVVRAHP